MIINFDDVNKYNADKVLERISDQSIYEYYLNHPIKSGELYRCCFHDDRDPSLGFKRMSSGTLIYNCFGCGAKGNVFNFVSNLKNISFKEAVKDVVDNLDNKNYKIVSTPDKIYYDTSKTIIRPIKRSFNLIDYNYWKRYYIPLTSLIKYDITASKAVYITQKSGATILINETSTNPIYTYQIDDTFKIYRPLNNGKKGKWFSNTTSFNIQGLKQLPEKGELLIITSSLKDVMVLDLMGYNAIALGGEGNGIPDKILDYLWDCFDNILIFYDNDEAGMKYADKLSNEIGTGYFHIPIEYSTKDISDFVEEYDFESGKNLISELIWKK